MRPKRKAVIVSYTSGGRFMGGEATTTDPSTTLRNHQTESAEKTASENTSFEPEMRASPKKAAAPRLRSGLLRNR